jgi:hypothetical protein
MTRTKMIDVQTAWNLMNFAAGLLSAWAAIYGMTR